MARKRKGKFIKAFFGLIVVLVALTYAWMVRERNQTEQDLAAIKNLGVPTSIEDYQKSLPHEANDGGKLYSTALDQWNKLPADDRKFIENALDRSKASLMKGMSDSDKKRVNDLLINGASLFRRAASTDWADVIDNIGDVDIDKSAAMETGIKLLIHSADQKEPFTKAFNDIYYAGRIAGNSLRAPVGVGEIRGAFVQEKEQLNGWRQTLARGSTDPKTIEAADRVLKNMPPIPGLPQVLHSVFVQGVWQNDNFDKYERALEKREPPREKDIKAKITDAIRKSPPINVERKRYFVSEWKGLFESLPIAGEDWRTFENAAVKAQRESKTPDQLRDGDPITFLPFTIRSRTEALAGRRIAKTSLAILMQRLKTGKLPTALPKLGKDSEDPFTGKPLAYLRTANGFIVYSVGKDEVDNKGAAVPDAKTGQYDIAQRYR